MQAAVIWFVNRILFLTFAFNLFPLKDALDFVAYVAKDVTEWRACYVIECGNEKAQSIISTMGKAFELRYKEYYGNEV